MPHLATFRKGWESENLARYILSRFSFIANPATVSDDIGIDFFCTIFLHQDLKGKQYLLPKNSFAIQIKSSEKKFDVTDKIDYLNNLELPYFIGVVSREKGSMRIYSGEYIPFFFTKVGIPSQLTLQPVEIIENEIFDGFYEEVEDGCYKLKFPFIMEISVSDNLDKLIPKAVELIKLSRVIQSNISSKNNHEYIFDFYKNPQFSYIFTGAGSVDVFRENFYKRLAEVFYNFEWIINNRPDNFDLNEFKIYEAVYLRIYEYNKFNIPTYLVGPYISLTQLIQSKGLK